MPARDLLHISKQQMLVNFMREEANKRNGHLGALGDCHAVLDIENGQYQLTRFGWNDDKFYFNVLFHLELKADGKIWIWQNNTETMIAKKLHQMGLSNAEIVLGFKPIFFRQHSGYAVG
jgi:XisI protein